MLKPILVAAFSALLAITAVQAAELKITEIIKGTGEEANVGETVVVHYTGWLMDGTKFDSSRDRNQPFSFTLGERRVIAGWEQGVEGMQVGGKRELIIPPELGYGVNGAGDIIPANATLKFEVELLDVKGKKFSNIDNDELKAKLAAGVPVIDIRRPDEWKATGVVPGSHLITFFGSKGEINPEFGAHLQKIISGPADEVVLMCDSGSRSMVLSRHLSQKAGFTQIDNVRAGISGWIASGGTVTDTTLPDGCWLC